MGWFITVIKKFGPTVGHWDRNDWWKIIGASFIRSSRQTDRQNSSFNTKNIVNLIVDETPAFRLYVVAICDEQIYLIWLKNFYRGHIKKEFHTIVLLIHKNMWIHKWSSFHWKWATFVNHWPTSLPYCKTRLVKIILKSQFELCDLDSHTETRHLHVLGYRKLFKQQLFPNYNCI